MPASEPTSPYSAVDQEILENIIAQQDEQRASMSGPRELNLIEEILDTHGELDKNGDGEQLFQTSSQHNPSDVISPDYHGILQQLAAQGLLYRSPQSYQLSNERSAADEAQESASFETQSSHLSQHESHEPEYGSIFEDGRAVDSMIEAQNANRLRGIPSGSSLIPEGFDADEFERFKFYCLVNRTEMIFRYMLHPS